MRIFPNQEACLRMVTALAVEQSEEWLTGRSYLNMEELREHRRLEEQEAEEAISWSSRGGAWFGGIYRNLRT